MSENKCRAERDFSRFDSMSTAQLQEILRQDALQESTEPDTEKILYITEVLAKREKERDPSAEVQRAYASFVQNYMPADQTNTPKKVTAFLVKMPRWMKSATVLVIVLGLLLIGSASADAMGFDLFGMVANWTAEVFHFSNATEGTEYTEPEQKDSGEYISLQEALDDYKIQQRLAPSWFPEGYLFVEAEIFDTPFERSIYAIYAKGEENIQISIRQTIGKEPEQVEKNEDFIEVYTKNGVTYYIFRNIDYTQAVWTVDEFECVIAGNVTTEEIKAMIDSI